MRAAIATAFVVSTACGRVDFDTVADGRPSSPYAAAVLADLPVAYWRLGDVGAIARDEIGGSDGTLEGGFTTGVGGALHGDPDAAMGFDGSTGRVVGPDRFPFLGTAPLSLECWVREPDITRYQHFVTKEIRANGTPMNGYAILQVTGGVYFERIYAGAQDKQTTPTPIAPDTWTHVVGTYDGSMMRIYFDGVERDTLATPGAIKSYASPLLLAAHQDGANVLGSVDEIAIYDHALAPDRIALHHALATSP